LITMRAPFGQAADFFGRAYAFQEQAAQDQAYADSKYDTPDEYNLQLQSQTIGMTPPSAVGDYEAEKEEDSYMRGMKDELLETARQKKRPTNGDTAMRASGGINTAVKR